MLFSIFFPPTELDLKQISTAMMAGRKRSFSAATSPGNKHEKWKLLLSSLLSVETMLY
jgi:hypothetical protein